MNHDLDCIHRNLKGKKSLVITAGESWTWGDSIPEDIRLTSIYGYHLSNFLDSDFINIAKRGASNIWIHDNTRNLLEEISEQYDSIYVFFTLTELCREADWDPIWQPKDFSTLNEFLFDYEKSMLESFHENFIEKYPEIRFFIARNFTYTIEKNRNLYKEQVEKTWIDVLSEYQNYFEYPTDLRMLSQIAYVPLHKALRKINMYHKWKFDFFEHYAASEMAMTWLDNSALNYKIATRHPTELGHELWAKHLYGLVERHT